jgi:hypothetical protein
MKKHSSAALLLVLGAIAYIIIAGRQPPPQNSPAPAEPKAAVPVVPAELPAAAPATTIQPVAEPVATAPAPMHPIAQTAAMEAVHFLIRDYRAAFGENPVGSNAEIVKTLRGANPKKTDFLAGTPTSVNTAGELLDPWGTPIFFHQLSARDMEIRSAGPDKQMWTGDDVIVH